MSQLDVLAQNFEEAFSAPGGMGRLRELILTLAMQGKLVEQDPAEGTADELLRDIETEKGRLVAEGKIKSPKPLPPIEPEEMPYELPQGWRWVRLGTFLELINGRAFKPSEWLDAGLPIVRIQNLNNRNAQFNYCDPKTIDDRHIIEREEFLISWSGTPGTSFGAFIWHGGRAALNQHIFKCYQIGKPYDDMFLRNAVNSRLDFLIGQAQGAVGLKHVTKGTLELMPLPLPPLAEQRRIVARIDQLMARCDELEALRAVQEQKRVQVQQAILREITADNDPAAFAENWQFLADHFGELHATPQDVAGLRSAVLQLAVMGKLVPQDPAEGTAQELLVQIEQEKRRLVAEGKIKAPKPLPPVSEAEQPYQVPQGWSWVRLGEITLVTSGITKGRNLTGRKLIEVPYLRVANVQRGYLNLDEMKNIDLPLDELEKYRVIHGDLLITEGGDWDKVGRTAIWRHEIENCTHQNHVFKARKVLTNQNEVWLQMFLNSAVSRNYFAGSAKQTTNLASINMTQLLACPIVLPPLAEQRRIVTKVDSLMALCDGLEARLRERTAKQGELLGAVMAQLAPTITARPVAVSRARAAGPASGAAPSGRGRPRKAVAEGAEAAGQQAGEKRGRGRPRKDGGEPNRSIPQASSVEDAIRKFEAQKLERAQGERMVSLFEE